MLTRNKGKRKSTVADAPTSSKVTTMLPTNYTLKDTRVRKYVMINNEKGLEPSPIKAIKCEPKTKTKPHLSSAESKKNAISFTRSHPADRTLSDSSLNSVLKELKKEEINEAEVLTKTGSGDIKTCHYESDDDGSAEDENFNFIQMRKKNIEENEQFLASIGIFKAKEELKSSSTKKTTVQRGLKVKKSPVAKELVVKRKSLRLSKLDPQGNPNPDPNSISNSLLTYSESIPFSQLCLDTRLIEPRLPEGPLKIKECLYTSDAAENGGLEILSSAMMSEPNNENDLEISSTKQDNTSEFNQMSLHSGRFAKTVVDRIFSLAWHPSTEKFIAAAGDKSGHIGFFDVMAEEKGIKSIVTCFTPHVKPVSQIKFSHTSPYKLFSSSYDSTLRCLDFEKGVFDEVFSAPADEDDLFRDFSFVDPNVMVVSRYSGFVSVVDLRTPTTTDEHSFAASKRNLHSIHVNPQSTNFFITAGAEACISLWDLRQTKLKSSKPLFTLHDHTKTISSAYFSPNGSQILSCSADDSFLIYSVKNHIQASVYKRIRHNNCTGRWLTKFRPTWHPTKENIFVSGSMAQPRRMEIFDSKSGLVIATLQDDEYMHSVCSLTQFHPTHPHVVVGANSSGKLFVYM